MRTSPVALFFGAALVVSSLGLVGPASSEQRSGAGPCRQGVLALIAMLDDGDRKSGDYKHAFTGVIETCGPVARSKTAPKPTETTQCRAVALRMLDEIEEGRLNGKAFVEARATFAQGCAPP